MTQPIHTPPTSREGSASRSKNIFVLFLFCIFCTCPDSVLSQERGFKFGQATYAELNQHTYALDTGASAIVLNEFGEAYIDGNDFQLNFEYHVKIKILKTEGLDKGNFEIALRKNGRSMEVLTDVEAASYNLQDYKIVESRLERKGVYTENMGEYWDLKKFAIPNVRVGSVIEVKYTLKSPFIMNFHQWEFQSDIPKLKSEYWAKIPGNYLYNISLKGFLKLVKNESTLVKECLRMGSGKADCALNKYSMTNIPAFIEEEYATASSNFISAINFELTEIRYFDGRVDKVTKEWKDVDDELRRDQKFGTQLKRGKEIAVEIDKLTRNTTDDFEKANQVFDFIKSWYRWNGTYGKYSEFGIKKAFDTKVGNVGDINLSLIAALRFAGLGADPVLLSTRENGIVTDLHPVLSDFNYVVAKFDHEGKTYLLDATDDFMPFGLLPERCLNGKGRVLGDKKSFWINIEPIDKRKSLSVINLKLEHDGYLRGTIQNLYSGYEAAAKRKSIFGFSSVTEYFKDLDNKLTNIEITGSELENLDDLSKPLKEKLVVGIEAFDELSAATIYFNPFLVQQWKENPFKSSERLYPVDFAYPLEWTLSVQLELPDNMYLEENPEPVALALPGNGGYYRYQVTEMGKQISMQSTLMINRPLFHAAEYHYLKELFSRVIHTQNIDLVFIKK